MVVRLTLLSPPFAPVVPLISLNHCSLSSLFYLPHASCFTSLIPCPAIFTLPLDVNVWFCVNPFIHTNKHTYVISHAAVNPLHHSDPLSGKWKTNPTTNQGFRNFLPSVQLNMASICFFVSLWLFFCNIDYGCSCDCFKDCVLTCHNHRCVY